MTAVRKTTHTIARDSLLSLEAYARQRKEFRAKVMAHKRNRTVHLGAHVTLIFEDQLTVRYQVQEMLRIERTFEEQGIQDELDVYNLSLIHISEPTRRTPISYAVFCLK